MIVTKAEWTWDVWIPTGGGSVLCPTLQGPQVIWVPLPCSVVAQVGPEVWVHQCQKWKISMYVYSHHFYAFLHHNIFFSRNRCFSAKCRKISVLRNLSYYLSASLNIVKICISTLLCLETNYENSRWFCNWFIWCC